MGPTKSPYVVASREDLLAFVEREADRTVVWLQGEAVADSNELMRQSTQGPDFREGVDSYLESRPPAFLPLGEGTTYPWMKRN